MDEPKPATQQPSFVTLTEIMERFAAVPYERFQQELQAWFEHGLQAQGRDIATLSQEGFPNLPELVRHIYHQAEVHQTLSDHQIHPPVMKSRPKKSLWVLLICPPE